MKTSTEIQDQINALKADLRAAQNKEREELKKIKNAYSVEFVEYLLKKLNVKSWKDINLKAFVDNLEPFEVIEPKSKDVKEFKSLIKEMKDVRKGRDKEKGSEMKSDYVISENFDM